MNRIALAAALLLLTTAAPAFAGNLLFVSDSGGETSIADVLEADGHTVTRVLDDYAGGGTPALQADLSEYHAVFWQASGTGSGNTHDTATTDAVLSYAAAGGFVFVTGYDSIASPTDSNLIALLGGTGSADLPGAPGAIGADANVLTTGLFDLRGVTPTGASSDKDGLTGLTAGTVAVAYTAGSTTSAQWTLRSVGSGSIAYVSAGLSGAANDPAWAAVGGAYNGVIRNFAYWASTSDVLFVSDSGADAGIVSALERDDHRVTTETDVFSGGVTPPLERDLSAFDVVIWSATGDGFGSLHSASTTDAITAWVAGGGSLFITGYDSMDSPDDTNLRAIFGCTGGRDVPTSPGPIINEANGLTTGLYDLRGVTPTGLAADRDALSSCAADVVAVVSSSGTASEIQWILRPIGDGMAVWVSNGDSGTASHVSWTTETNAAHRALRNFVYNASRKFGVTPDSDEDDDGFPASVDCNDDDPLIFPGAAEACDGVDNDCDDATVDGADEATLGDECDGADADLCREGSIVCAAGALACSDTTGDNLDVCDGLDNDCNPATADGLDEASFGDDCDGADADLCQEGSIVCSAGALACSDTTGDNLDLCDGLDNDCNPATADGADDASIGGECDGADADLCQEGSIVCAAGALACSDTSGDNLDLCDGLDNDCNPATADGLDEATLGDDCDGADADLCEEGAIVCTAGALACSDDSTDNAEVCDGEDNDCNPATADGLDEATLGDDCDGADTDLCQEGAVVCSDGSLACTDTTGDDLEFCDGEDNDCNPATADGAGEDTLGDGCDGDDSDLCEEGAIVCTAGALACSDETDDNVEVCDGEDNDCDPGTDDGADEATLGDGCDGDDSDLCEEGAVVCTAGALACSDETDDDLEVCDGEDNDCDGAIDDADEDIRSLDPSDTSAGIWFADNDDDGCGDPDAALYLCADVPPDAYVSNALDLDDSDGGGCCGNGVVDDGEVCDGVTLGDLPATCVEYDGGYVDGGIACSATCDVPDESACVDNVCGDGVTAGDEACDDGGRATGDGCDSDCGIEPGWSCDGLVGTTSDCAETCGDGNVDPYEMCDDGNLDAGDGCNDTCMVEEGWFCDIVVDLSVCAPQCGDGITLADERCDDGNTADGDGCSAECAPEPGYSCTVEDRISTCAETCGDGAVDLGEACDDGNVDADDGCSPICDIEAGWTCADGACETLCGDGLVRGAEADDGGCDDGNTDDGDGCDSACLVEENYLCTGEPSTCSLQAYCGDGARDDGESCDDGNNDDDDGCDSACSTESGWICDDAAPTVCVPDTDEDGVSYDDDNCVDVANEDQADLDEDDEGDACDDDRDGDGVANEDDACPDEFGDGDDGCDATEGDTGIGGDAGPDAGTADAGVDDDVTADGSGTTDDADNVGSIGGSSGGGCAAAKGSTGSPLALLALVGLLAVRRRR